MVSPISFEEWKLIDFYDIKKNLYEISNFGNIRNINTNNLLSQIYSNGYLTVFLQTDNGDRKSYYIHRLVAQAFVHNPDPDNKIEVNHLDLNRSHDIYLNLEWSTPLYNKIHSIENKGHGNIYKNKGDNNWSNGSVTSGERNGMSKLTDENVHNICKALEKGKSYSESLIEAGLDDTENNRFIVSHIVQKKRWRKISDQYNIPESNKNIDYSIYAEDICVLLSKHKTVGEIIHELNLPGSYDKCRHAIGRIRRKESYTDISCKYDW